jgi:hypothetical protein
MSADVTSFAIAAEDWEQISFCCKHISWDEDRHKNEGNLILTTRWQA